jgi:sugar transferase EpsL
MLSKRVFDIFASALLLLVLWPLMVVVSLAAAFSMGAPVCFRQSRVGWHGKLFPILKFRTMTDPATRDGHSLTDSERTTSFGRFMRESSIDELPQLINVLLGQMSLVGPRPLMQQYVEQCTSRERKRFEMRPGITGLAQISGRKALSYSDRFAIDVSYVDNWSLWLDLKIMLATVVVVLRRDGLEEPTGQPVSALLGLGRR